MNTFGRKFRVSIFGESHGEVVGVTLDGVIPGLELSEQDFFEDIKRRKSGAKGTTPRIEEDMPIILSGVYEGKTTGAPLTIIFKNSNCKSKDYSQFRDIPRPGHADYTASVKYKGYNDPRGGGQFSGRMTLPYVAAGVVAKKIISQKVEAKLIAIGGEYNQNKWESLLNEVMKEGDSLGGIVECRVKEMQAGLGEPFFDSMESLISHAIFAIPGVRGIEFGDGFVATSMKGTEHNDPILNPDLEDAQLPDTEEISKLKDKDKDSVDREVASKLKEKNGAGGINGGISNGNDIVFRVAFKPTSTVRKSQLTYNFKTKSLENLSSEGRHDACFALRTPVIVEAATAIVLVNLEL